MARKLFIVRWPDLSAALVYAHDEKELLYLLDAISDPSSCTWTVWNGPMYLDVGLGLKGEVTFTPDIPRKPAVPPIPGEPPDVREDFDARPLDPRDVTVTGEFDRGLEVQVGTDATPELVDEVLKFAFPNINKALEAAFEAEQDEPDNDAVLEAAKLDFVEGQNRSRAAMTKRAQSDHPLAPLARTMGTSVEALKAHGIGDKDDDDDDDDL